MLTVLLAMACDAQRPAQPFPDVISPFRANTLSDQPIPETLDQALDTLARGLSSAEMRTFRQMTERDVDELLAGEFATRRWIQESWGSADAPTLFADLARRGLTSRADIADAIVTSFWRRTHAQKIDLVSQLKATRAARATAEKRWADFAEGHRKTIEQLNARIQSMVMGLTLGEVSVPTIALRQRRTDGLRARYLAPFRDGVMMGVRGLMSVDGSSFRVEPYFWAPSTQTLRPVRIRELSSIWSSVVSGTDLWVVGEKDHKPRLVRITAGRHDEIALPLQDSIPQLGLDGLAVLAAYENSIYRYADGRWAQVYAGGKLPRSGPPVRVVNSRVYLRAEGWGENGKRLWWSDLPTSSKLVAHDADIGIGWEDALSYAFYGGDFWLTLGNSINAGWSLARRDPAGKYELAIVNGSLRYRYTEEPPEVSVSALAVVENRLLGAGNTGLYEITPKAIQPIVRFANTSQVTDDGVQWRWDPSDLLRWKPQLYVISGVFGGIYLVEQRQSAYRLRSLDERIGKAVWF